MRGMGCARREVDEERLVGREGLLLADPADRLVRHVLREVVSLFGRILRLHRSRAFVDRWVVLVGLARDEPVEVLEPSASGRPRIERAHRARLPHRHLVALAELRRRIAVEPQRLRERRTAVRPDRVVPGRRGRDLSDPPHPDGVVVAPRQQCLPGRRAERGRVKAVQLQPVRRQPLRRRRRARSAERTRGAETDVIEQHDEYVRGSDGRPQRLDRREARPRVLRVFVHRPRIRPIRNR
jgi:hypothetical protein